MVTGRMAACAAMVSAMMLTTACTPVRTISGASLESGAVQEQRRPNLLFILVDDMGYGDLSITGNDLVQTPNIDRLALNGLLMTQFTVAAPICSASRAAFMTGRFPARDRFWNFLHNRAHNAATGHADWLDPSLPTLPRSLKAAGYATGHFGKWHMGGGRDVGDAPHPSAYGIDESYTQFEGLGPRALQIEDKGGLARQSAALGQGPIDRLHRAQLTGRYIDKALDFIGRQSGRPWYVALWLDDVHDPWDPDDAQLAAVRGKGRSSTEDRFLATLVAMDAQIGRLVEALRERGELNNTMIVLTGDNGPTGAPPYYKQAAVPGSAGVYRGRKGSLYEGGIREPLIVHWPDRIRPGLRDDTTIANAVDLYPTMAQAAGVAGPSRGDGISLIGAFEGRPVAKRPDLLYAYGGFGDTRRFPRPYLARDRSPPYAIRIGRWKLLAASDGAEPELYDLSADPSESRNLAESRPEIVEMLSARLRNWANSLPGSASVAD